MKSESAVVRVTGRRVRAMAVGCSVALMVIMTVGGAELVRAAAESATPAPSELFGVHPVQEGQTTLPGGHFNFALVPGQRISDGIVVENLSGRALTFDVYGADLVTAVGGGLAPAQPTATMRSVGSWIVVSARSVTIAAHAQATDIFTITVPSTASVGQHLGAVVAAGDVGLTAQGTPIEARVALIAVVTVPGTVRPAAMLTALSGSGVGPERLGFATTLANTGNVLLTYAGSVTINAADGRSVARVPLTPTNAYVVPNGRVPLTARWNEPTPLAGTYRAQATVTIFANGKPIRTLMSQTLVLRLSSGVPAFVPIALALVILVLLLLLAWNLRRVIRRRHSPAPRRVHGTGWVA